MSTYTQPQEGYGRAIITVYSLCGYIMSNFLMKWSDAFSPADHDDYLAHHITHIPTRTVPLPPTKTIYVPPTPSTPSVIFQIAVGVFIFVLIGSVMVVHAMLHAHSRPASSSPGYSSAPACWEEYNELLDIADDDDSSEGDRREHGGDGDDYPGDCASDEADKPDEEFEDALSPSEDPPPPPDPPSQTAAANPDSTPRSIPAWFLIFLFLFSATTSSLVLKHLVNRLRHALRRIKVYSGNSMLRLFVYIEDPRRALELAVHRLRLCHVLDWVKVYTGSSISDPTVYTVNSSYHAVAHTAVSSFADVEQTVAPFQLQNSSVVRQVAKWNITKLFTAYILPVMLKIGLAFSASSLGIFINLWWHLEDGISGELITQDEELQYVIDHQDTIVVQSDDVEIPLVAGADLKQHVTTQTDEDAFMDVIGFLFDLRLIFLDHQTASPVNCGALPASTTQAAVENVFVGENFSSICEDESYTGTSSANHRILLTPATVAVDVRESYAIENVTVPCSLSASFTCVVDEVLPATHDQDVGQTSEEDNDDDALFHYLPDASVSLDVPVEARMPFPTDSFVDSLKAPLGIRHGERVVINTPFLVSTSVQVSDIGGPVILPPIALPKRVLELRRSSFTSTITPPDATSPSSATIRCMRLFDMLRVEFTTPPDPPSPYAIIRRRRLFDTPRLEFTTPPDTTPPSDSINRCNRLFDTLRLELSLASESCGSQIPSVAEVEQSTLAEADAGFFGKANVPLSKLQITVEAEGVAAGCEPCLVGLAELVDEKSVWEDLEVALGSAVVTAAAEEPLVELPKSVVEEKLVEAPHSSTFAPADEAPIGSQEQDGEDSSPIDFVDIDADNEVEEVEAETRLDDSDYEEEDALWIHHSDEDEEDEAEVPMELLSGLFEPIDSQNDHEVNQELRPQSVVSCHDENTTHQHCGDPSSDLSAALYGPSGTTELNILPVDVFGPTVENVSSSRQRETAPTEDSPLFCPQASSTFVLEVPPTYTLDPPEFGRKPTALPVDAHDVVDVFGPTIENIFGSRQRVTAAIEDSPELLFCPQASSSFVLEVRPTSVLDHLKFGQDGAHVDAPTDVAGAARKQNTWPLRRVMQESKVLQNQEDTHRWQLRPLSPTHSPGPPEVNEFQRMRSALRRPANMTDQEKRLRQVWELHGTEKGRALKERRLRRTRVAQDSG